MARISNLSRRLIFLFSTYWLFANIGCSNKNEKWSAALERQINEHDATFHLDSMVIYFMAKYHIPGLSLAVTKDDKLVYAKSYGLANLSTGEEVTNKSLFHIGGSSMSITAIAITKLVEQNKLSFDSKVFGDSGILGFQFGHKPYRPYITDITVGHLLNHTCGGWSGGGMLFEPKLRDASYSKSDLLSRALDDIPLQNKPGTSFAYSEFGYFILGRVIEKVSGMKYDDYVKENIFKPIGITDMEIEEDTVKKKNEVTFYKDRSWPTYNAELDENLFINRADASAGWMATSTDMVKLMVKLKSPGPAKNMIDSNIKRYSKINPDFVGSWYLQDAGKNWGWTSDFFAASFKLQKSPKGFCLAILVNTYRPVEKDYFRDMGRIANEIMDDSTIKWPGKDLF